MARIFYDIIPPKEDKSSFAPSFGKSSSFVKTSEDKSEGKKATADKSAGKEEKIAKKEKNNIQRAETKRPKPKLSRQKRFGLRSVLILSVFLVSGLAVYFIPGQAEIEIWPDMETVNFNASLVVDKDAKAPDQEAALIPSFPFSAEKDVSREFFSSGKKILEKKSEGVIRVYNNYSKSQTLVAGTRFQATLDRFQPSLQGQEKPWFKTVEKIAVSAKSYKEVKVAADSPGEKYNIKPSKFSIPGLAGSPQYTLIYGESFQDFQGGEKKEVPQVLANDLEKAEAELSKEAEEGVLEELRNKIPSGFLLMEDSLKAEITENFSSARAGNETEKFIYQTKAVASGLMFKKEDLEKFSQGYVLSKVPAGKRLKEQSLKINYSLSSFVPENNRGTLTLDLKADIYSPVDDNFLKEGLAGKSISEAEFLLENQQGISISKIKLWPFWLKKIPREGGKIKLIVKID